MHQIALSDSDTRCAILLLFVSAKLLSYHTASKKWSLTESQTSAKANLACGNFLEGWSAKYILGLKRASSAATEAPSVLHVSPYVMQRLGQIVHSRSEKLQRTGSHAHLPGTHAQLARTHALLIKLVKACRFYQILLVASPDHDCACNNNNNSTPQ